MLHTDMNPDPNIPLEGWMTPFCLHREEWVCEKCLKCGACCACSPLGALVHRNSRRAADAYATMLREGTQPRS